MSLITSIEPQIKDKTRCNIYIDGRYFCGMKLEVVVGNRLKAGMEIDEARLAALQLETEQKEALDKAFTHLSLKPKTEREMRLFLEKKGYSPAVCDFVLDKLRYYGYVNDADYCKQYIESAQKKSKRALQADLIKRGIDKEVVDEALKAYNDDEDEILELLKKYLRGKEPTRENVYKGCRYLVSKGYEYDAVKRAGERIDEDGDN